MTPTRSRSASTQRLPSDEVYCIYPHPEACIHYKSGKKLPFTYEAVMNERSLLFIGKTAENKCICIKFVRRYGLDVHLWFARKQHAPELVAFENLDGGWFMVVMELLDESWIRLVDAKDPPADLKDMIYADVTELHQENMVHGDLRDTNIMVKTDGESSFMVLDYDWAGTQGKARYPAFTNKAPELGRPSDVEDGVFVTTQHDVLMLQHMFRDL